MSEIRSPAQRRADKLNSERAELDRAGFVLRVLEERYGAKIEGPRFYEARRHVARLMRGERLRGRAEARKASTNG